ncbi:MAG TPA: hypothetical protein VFK05_38065 [Polyangiaceae bacterium]|nr:hypothetical protein [Polyangiaceae bacterium]
MARGPFLRSCAPWLVGAILTASCAGSSDNGTPAGRAGSSAGGAGGAHAGIGGSAGDVGGTASGQGGTGGASESGAGSAGFAGGGTSGASVGGASGNGGSGGNLGGSAADAGSAGFAEGGEAGSTDRVDFDGRCGTGWAAVGSARPPKLSGDITPQSESGGDWSFSFGRYRLVVAGAHGAHVIEFSLDGNNLIDPTGGSTFWPSPQQAYTWPPPAEIDTAAYTARSDATSLSLKSATSSALGLSVNKRFWVNAESGVVSIEYQLINQSKQAASWAPWEVTRVRAGGYTFAPRGPGNRTITQDSFQNPLPLSLLPPPPAADAIEWLNYPSLTLTKDNYITEFDGAEGWLAHANRFGKNLLPVLFVKSFVDAQDERLPTNQAEIQLWTSGTANPKLIEVEEQGEEVELAPGATLSWTVHWSACELASSSLLSAGNAELAALARAHAVKP